MDVSASAGQALYTRPASGVTPPAGSAAPDPTPAPQGIAGPQRAEPVTAASAARGTVAEAFVASVALNVARAIGEAVPEAEANRPREADDTGTRTDRAEDRREDRVEAREPEDRPLFRAEADPNVATAFAKPAERGEDAPSTAPPIAAADARALSDAAEVAYAEAVEGLRAQARGDTADVLV